MAYDKAFAALADPSRRRVFERLQAGPLSVGALAKHMPVSRPAVSQHLKVLKEAGLMIDHAEGTRRVYAIDPQGLAALRSRLDQFWDDALAAFRAEAEQKQNRERQLSMNKTVTIAPVCKSVRVKASQAHAFEVFTAGLDRWWPRKASIGAAPMKAMMIEPRLGGRWYEVGADGSQATVGRVLLWDPPNRLTVSWDIDRNWKPNATVGSEVEVRFTIEGPEATLVELEHRKFEQMGAEAGASLRKDVDGGWPGILEGFRAAAEQ